MFTWNFMRLSTSTPYSTTACGLPQERSVPAEVLELPQKGDRIIHFAWEPHVREPNPPAARSAAACVPQTHALHCCRNLDVQRLAGQERVTSVDRHERPPNLARGRSPVSACSENIFVVTLAFFALQGTRFAILHGDGPKPNLSVYEMKDVRSAVKAVQPVVHNPSRAANVIHWSPTGKNMVLAGLKVKEVWAIMLC
jgi:Eukaryotic translation initiation factor eIF2A